MSEQAPPTTEPFRLSVGGDVQASNGTYLTRPVDEALLKACLDGKFAYVLACRQIGKSSLKNAVAEELSRRGVQVARVDLNRIGQNVSAQEWYYTLLDEVARSLGLRTQFAGWWEDQPALSTHAQRFLNFFDQLVLPQSEAPVVIFLDEIDMTLGLPFTDDLFAAIRSVYNDRAQNADYHRLSSVLLGVATPDDLIHDATRTPFNVGDAIAIHDFAQVEIAPLFSTLIEARHPGQGASYFGRIFEWTNGHPYLTQRLTQAVLDSPDSPPNLVDAQVDAQVRTLFLTEGERLEINLNFVQSRVLGDAHVVGMMQTHRRLLAGKPVADAQKSPAINHLKLYGLVTAENGFLRIRNRIYAQVFDRAWNRKHYPINWSWRIAVAAVSVLILLVLTGAGIMIHDYLWLPGVANQLNHDFSAAQAHGDEHGQCVALAGLYNLDESMWGPGVSDYALQSDQHLARLNADETIQLFDPPADPCQAALIAQLYQELVDTDLLGATQATANDRLLQAMANSQPHTEATANATPPANGEVAAWARARSAVRSQAYAEAVDAYSTAIASNATNVSLPFERAQVYVAQDDFAKALADLDAVEKQMAAFAGATATPVPTLTPTATFTRLPIPTTNLNIDQQQLQQDFTDALNTAITSGTVEVPSPLPTTIPTLSPSPTPTARPNAIQRTEAVVLLGAMRTLFDRHPLMAGVEKAIDRYPNLAALGLSDQSLPAVYDAKSADYVTNLVALAPQEQKRWGRGDISQTAYLPDRSQLAVATSIGIWLYKLNQPDDGHLLAHTASVNSVSWSPDGNQVASGVNDNTVLIWDVASGAISAILQGHTASVNSVSWPPDGSQVASGADDNTVLIWDVANGEAVAVLEGHTGGVKSVSWSSEGVQVASGADDSTVRIWDVASGEAVAVLEGHTGGVKSVSWSSEGGQVASGAVDGTVRIWDVASGEAVAVLEGHTGGVRSVDWSSDGGQITSSSSDGTVRIWEVAAGEVVGVLQGRTSLVRSVSWSPDGRHVASGADDNSVRILDVASGATVAVLQGHTSIVLSVSWSPNGSQVASGAHDSTVRIWEVVSGEAVIVLQGHTSLVLSVSWSPDGRQVASGSSDNTVRIWDVESGEVGAVLQGHTSRARSVSWSPDGVQVASGADDGTVRIWDVAGGEAVVVLQGHAGDVESVSWSPDGHQVASGGHDSMVRIWDVYSGEAVAVLQGHTGDVKSVSWSPDGRQVASGASDGTIRIWDIESGEAVSVLRGHTSIVLSVSWSPDGKQLVSSANDGTVRIWDVDE